MSKKWKGYVRHNTRTGHFRQWEYGVSTVGSVPGDRTGGRRFTRRGAVRAARRWANRVNNWEQSLTWEEVE